MDTDREGRKARRKEGRKEGSVSYNMESSTHRAGLGGSHIWRPQWVGWRGSPKNRWKKQNQLICDSIKGGGKKSENFADVKYGRPLTLGFGDLPKWEAILSPVLGSPGCYAKRAKTNGPLPFRTCSPRCQSPHLLDIVALTQIYTVASDMLPSCRVFDELCKFLPFKLPWPMSLLPLT